MIETREAKGDLGVLADVKVKKSAVHTVAPIRKIAPAGRTRAEKRLEEATSHRPPVNTLVEPLIVVIRRM